MTKEKYPHLWSQYNTTFNLIQNSKASKNSSGHERNYGHAAEQLMHVGELYRLKAKYRGK